VLNIVFFGIQGSGKGTQAVLLEKKHKFDHVSIGDLLREHMADKTELGEKIKKYMLAGELVPDEYIFSLIEDILHPKAHGIIFDGFPRTLRQAKFMEERIPVNYAVYFDLDDETAIKRLTARRVCKNCNRDFNLLLKPPKKEGQCDHCGGELIQRDDDHKEAIVRRIKIFHQRTKPLIEFYEEKDKYIHIDASDPPDKIFQSLVNSIKIEQ